MNRLFIASLAGTIGLASVATAAEIEITEDITTATVWTADNTYNLKNQIYVLPGASLTIEAGTVIASDATANGSGSFAVCRGAKIFALGTVDEPIVMTSKNDDRTNWREACNEWGNLTVMGNAYVSNTFESGNTATFGNNVSPMEGLVPEFKGDTRVYYGGTDDDDNSGALSHLSIRYGGRVVGLANELNGLSLGGIGRGTDIDHIEIMNNVDDGIEIWGGTVNLRYVSIWNIGDDSFDIDQGWRGSAQYGLIVQGYSRDGSQGSGVGDNMCETDGAENSDAQPVTTAQIANFTMIGQPIDGDGATAWRDGARVQYNQCSISFCGEKVLRPDGDDGDGSAGYGHNGSLTMADVFSTAYDSAALADELNAPDDRNAFYTAQVSGNLAQIQDSVLFGNSNYDDFNAMGQNAAARNNSIENASAGLPYVAIERDSVVVRGGKAMLRVTSLDPRAAGDAVTAVGDNGVNGFVEAASFRGGFAPDSVWLCGWSAADEFGMISTPEEFCAVALPCPADLSGDGLVNGADVGNLLACWGSPCGDLDGDGTTTGSDFGALLAAFGPCP